MTIEQAAALGFLPDEAEHSLAMIEAASAAPGTFGTAMDLARLMNVPLTDAAAALIVPKRLRRWLPIPPDADPVAFVRDYAAGQAEAYALTLCGTIEVIRARSRLRRGSR
jgi:hypothetical protein